MVQGNKRSYSTSLLTIARMKHDIFDLTGVFKKPYNASANSHFSEVPPIPPNMIAAKPTLISTTNLQPELVSLAKQAEYYFAYQHAESTDHIYEQDWEGFKRWCDAYRLCCLPAEVRTVALYISSLAERKLAVSTIKRHLAAIKTQHEHAGFQTPTQSEIIKGIKRGISRKHGIPPHGAEALLPEALKKIIDEIDLTTLIGKRDLALLLVGFYGALRRSELVGLSTDDIQWSNEGVVLLLHHSKTDQHGKGMLVGIPRGKRPETCPVIALETWLMVAGIKEGAVFRGMDCHDRIVSERLSGRAVPMIIKCYAKAAGLDPAHLSGHSLRAGHCTSAARAGVPYNIIMKQTRHASLQTMLKYIEMGKLFVENSASAISL